VAVPFGVVSYDIAGGRVIAPYGEIDVSNCQQFAEHVTGPPGSLLVVDLARLTFIDSSGLGALHGARRRAIEEGGNLVVSRPSAVVHRVFEITGLDIWLTDWNVAWSSESVAVEGDEQAAALATGESRATATPVSKN
jgi:anti-sigma B factor antagonist